MACPVTRAPEIWRGYRWLPGQGGGSVRLTWQPARSAPLRVPGRAGPRVLPRQVACRGQFTSTVKDASRLTDK